MASTRISFMGLCGSLGEVIVSYMYLPSILKLLDYVVIDMSR